MDLYDYLQKVRPAFLQMAPKRKTQTKVETDRLFIGAGGNCYSLSNLMTPLMARVRKMNTKVQHAQQLRASVITGWVKVYSLRKAQYLAGHRYLSSTEWYLKNDLEGLQEAIHHYHPLG